jgi:hypothetical protein
MAETYVTHHTYIYKEQHTITIETVTYIYTISKKSREILLVVNRLL